MALALVLAGAAASCSSTSAWTGGAAPSGGGGGGTGQEATEQLVQLPVRPQTTEDTYRREAYGPRWADVTESGCNTIIICTAVAGGCGL